jgi:hypothetical protein
VALIAGALLVTVWNYRQAVRAREVAAAAAASAVATRSAEAVLAREHETMDDYLLRARSQLVADAIGRLEDRFDADLYVAGFAEPNEQALVHAAVAANGSFVGIVALPHERVTVDSFRRVDRLLDSAEDQALGPLRRLRALEIRQQGDAQADANFASRRALVSAIVAGALAIAAESAPGEGTTFRVELPLSPQRVAA